MSRRAARGVPPAGHSSAQTARIPQHSQREDGQQPGHAALLPPGRPREGAANLSPGPGRAAPAGRGRSSAGCPRAARSRSKPSRPPTRATAPPPRPGWPRAPAPRGPLRGHGRWAGVPVPPPPQPCTLPAIPTSPARLPGSFRACLRGPSTSTSCWGSSKCIYRQGSTQSLCLMAFGTGPGAFTGCC